MAYLKNSSNQLSTANDIIATEERTMDATTVLTVIPVTVGICTLLHLLLEKRKNERITFLQEQLTEARRQLEEAKKQSPDALAQSLHNTVLILRSQLTELNKEKETDKETHAEEIKKKEQELANALARIEELNEQMNTAQEILEEYSYFKEEFSCEYCGASLDRREYYEESSLTSYECGHTVGDHFNQPCPRDPEFPTLDEYEIVLRDNQNRWYCIPKPKTKNAHKLTLDSTWGDTAEQAKQRMIEKYRFRSRNVPKKI
jgi:hypothetical protein